MTKRQFKVRNLAWKSSIRMVDSRLSRFWEWFYYYLSFPFRWIDFKIKERKEK